MYYFLWNINIVYMSIFNIYTFLEYMTTLYYVYVLENGIYDNGIYDNGIYDNGIYDNGIYDNGILDIID